MYLFSRFRLDICCNSDKNYFLDFISIVLGRLTLELIRVSAIELYA